MAISTGGIGPLLTGSTKMPKKTLPPTAKTGKNPPGGNASFERQKATKKPKAKGRRTIGDRYGMSI